MTNRNRTKEDKVADWLAVYNAVREEITPPVLRQMLTKLTETPPADAAEAMGMLQASLGIARVVTANDRAAAVVAAMLTQSGVSRPTLDVIDGGDA